MSDSNKSTTGTFTADIETSSFESEKVSLSEHLQSSKLYWRGQGQQIIDSNLPISHAWVGVYFPEGTTPNTYTLTENGDYRASYAFGTLNDPKIYWATSGTLTLKVAPTERDPRLEGSVEFSAKLQNSVETVEIKNGQFVMEGLSAYESDPFDKP